MRWKWKRWFRAKKSPAQAVPAHLAPPRQIEQHGQAFQLPLDGKRTVELASVLRPDEPWLDGGDAVARIRECVAPERHVGREHANALTREHWELLWPVLAGASALRLPWPTPEGPSEIRLLFFAGERIAERGYVWVPCVILNAKGLTVSDTWIVRRPSGPNNILTARDLLVLRLT